QQGAIAMNGGQAFPIELHEELVKSGMPALSPYSYINQDFVGKQERLGANIMKALHAGDLSLVNAPESLDAINQAYADQVASGIGESSDEYGGKVIAKRISTLQTGPGGAVVANVQVHLDNGKSYDAPLTIARSSDPHDLVRMNNAGTMIDDVMGRYRLAQLAKSPEYQQSVRNMYEFATRNA